MDEILTHLKTHKFRNFSILGVDVECTTSPQPYKFWAEDAKHFQNGFPTHENYVGKYARWLSIANPYGYVAIIDCAKVSKRMFNELKEFLFNNETIVVMFGAYEDLWSLHLTFGNVIPGFETSNGIVKKLIRESGIFGQMRVFDLKNVVDLTMKSVDID